MTSPVNIPIDKFRCDACNIKLRKVEVTYHETDKKTRFCSNQCFVCYKHLRDLYCNENFEDIMKDIIRIERKSK